MLMLVGSFYYQVLIIRMFLWLFLGCNQYCAGLVLVVLCLGIPKGSSGSGFKVSQKTGPRLKVLSDRLRWQREDLLCSLAVL